MLLDTACSGAILPQAHALTAPLRSFLAYEPDIVDPPRPAIIPLEAVSAAPPPFRGFPKIARLMREIVATEKLNGTNGLIEVTEWGDVFAGSRNRWLTPGKGDNFGFAAWVEGHRSELLTLGVGRHFGEWWGRGIQAGYGLEGRRFSLFNVGRWRSQHQDDVFDADLIDPAAEYAPMCCHVVPTLYRGMFSTVALDQVIADLAREGSRAARGFGEPEGIIVFHTAASVLFKRLIEGDEKPKGLLH